MIIVDNALRARAGQGNPIRVGIIGAGFMARGLAHRIINSTPGMAVVAVSNRRPERAFELFRYAGLTDGEVVEAGTLNALEDAIRRRKPAVTADAFLLARSAQIDVLVETTGSVNFAAQVLLEAFKYGHDVVLLNAEIDATIGPILQVYADRAGVILSACDGDEPGVQMNLYRWVQGLGLIPRVIGIVRGLHDPYRDPTTQKAFAEKWGQNPAIITSSADGSKVSFEQAVVANATGFGVRSRGMSRGLEYRGDVMQMGAIYDIEELRRLGGIVDYVVGTPLAKVYCLAEQPDPAQQRYLSLYKMGDGPLYSFFVPYHLVHFEVPNTIARVALFRDSVAKPLHGPVVEVCAVAKRDLAAGDLLDDCGQYLTYGEAVNTVEMSTNRYLPEALADGCRLKHAIAKDTVISYDDVVLPEDRVADRLRAEQYHHFRGEAWLAELSSGAAAPTAMKTARRRARPPAVVTFPRLSP